MFDNRDQIFVVIHALYLFSNTGIHIFSEIFSRRYQLIMSGLPPPSYPGAGYPQSSSNLSPHPNHPQCLMKFAFLYTQIHTAKKIAE